MYHATHGPQWMQLTGKQTLHAVQIYNCSGIFTCKLHSALKLLKINIIRNGDKSHNGMNKTDI